MFMKRLIALTLVAGVFGLAGCESKTGTAPSTNPNKPNETRSIRVTASGSHTITQGETDDVLVEVTRSNNKEEVTLEVSDLPKGVVLDSKDVTVPADKNSITLRLKADPTAMPVDNHVFHIVGKSKDIKSEALDLKLTVKAKK
jgi:hypothetical protein